ncbi:hypothetical protein ACJJTC_019097 [Scirpophaga incertulas]
MINYCLIQVLNNNEQDIYEVQDGGSTIKFIYPKTTLPALREIVYYHMVEHPYNESDAESVDDTRPFTNSHGHELETSAEQEDRLTSSTDRSKRDVKWSKHNYREDNSDRTNQRSRTFNVEAENSPYFQPRTYGMDLQGDSGIVWNNLFISPDFINENDKKTTENNRKIPEPPVLGEISVDDLPSNVRRKISSEMLNTHKYETEEENPEKDSFKNRMQKIFRDIDTKTKTQPEIKPRTYGMYLEGDSGVIWNNLNENQGRIIEIERTKSNDVNKEHTADGPAKHHNTKEDDEEDQDNEKMGTIVEGDKDDQESVPELKREEDRKELTRKNKNKNKPNFNQFLENDEFWNWLSSWTSLAMTSIFEHIDDKIEEELLNQIDALNVEPTHKKNLNEPNSENSSNKNTPIKDFNGLNNEYNVTESKKDIITNVENANITRNNSIKETPANIKTTNLYGNSVGNEKVTNIFIFYPNKDTNNIIDTLKLKNNSNISVNVFSNDTQTTKNNSNRTQNEDVNEGKEEKTSIDVEKSTDKENVEPPHTTTISLTSEAATEASSEAATEISSDAATEISSETATETSSEAATEISSEAATETLSKAATEISSEAATESKTDEDVISNNPEIDKLNSNHEGSQDHQNTPEDKENTEVKEFTEESKLASDKTSEREQEKAVES